MLYSALYLHTIVLNVKENFGFMTLENSSQVYKLVQHYERTYTAKLYLYSRTCRLQLGRHAQYKKKHREISGEFCLASTRFGDTHLEYCLNIMLSSGQHIP